MNGIYYCEGIDSDDRSNLGIEEKVRQQIRCLNSFSKVTVICKPLDKSALDRIKFLLPYIKSTREKQREAILGAANDKTTYIYIRKPSLTVHFYKLLRKIKRLYPSIYIIMEIPTYPFHSEYKGISKIMAIKSSCCERKLHHVIDRIATYSDDDAIWKIPTIKLSNCVDYSKIPPRNKNYKPLPHTIRLTCVANFTYWHGIDRLIEGIKKYKGTYKIILNLVGGGKEIKNLKELANNMPNVIFHGPKSGNDLTEIFNQTDIAVDALGRHRSGVFYNSSLKGKEYSARGIPIISAVETELDRLNNYPYYLRFPADESPISIIKISKFYEKIYRSNNPVNITKTIRQLTKDCFDYKNSFQPIIEKSMLGTTKPRSTNEK